MPLPRIIEKIAAPGIMRGVRRYPLKPRALLRGILLCLVILVLAAPPQPLVVLGPPQTVHTVAPKMGMHTRLTDEVEPWKIKRTLQMVREMGAPWVVEYFPWAYHEPAPGRFDWAHADLVVDHAVT
ncbi:MAG: hypothetical protein WAV60_18160, partial [Anaerolineae bacterium]